jgi:DNA-binding beta-propeller fold protein YncE
MRSSVAVGVCVLLGAWACARAPGGPSPQSGSAGAAGGAAADPTSAELLHASCARRGKGDLPLRAAAAGRQGGAIVLARSPKALLAYVADADSKSVHTVDVDAGRELVRTRVGGAPAQLVVLGDGRLVASLADGTHIAVLEPGADPAAPLATLCERQVPVEPWGLAVSPGDAKLVVTSAWGAALTVFDESSLAAERVVPLPRDPRSVLVDDANVAYVSHLVGAKMSVVDLGSKSGASDAVDLHTQKSSPGSQLNDMMSKRTSSQGYALAKVALPVAAGAPAGTKVTERVLAPMVSVDAGDFERATRTYYGPPPGSVPKEAPFVSVVDPDRKTLMSPYLLSANTGRFTRECMLPRAAAVRENTGSLLVACFGIDAVLELDALALDPFRAEKRRFVVPPGPAGLAVDEDGGRAVVFSQFAATVVVVDLDKANRTVATIDLDYHPSPEIAAVARGRQLFYRTDDVRIADDGISCSSCHPDGREDAITWSTPMGPRQTLMLAGRMTGTAPYGWEGDQRTLPEYVANTVENRLGGVGLPQEDLNELSAYVLTVKGPPRAAASPNQASLVAQGAALFQDAEVGCVTCHVAGTSTDAQTHDLGPGVKDVSKIFDTPSLVFVRGTAPYFHDGRYGTLELLLSDADSKMGHSAALSDDDRGALAAYLRSL